MIFCHQWWSLNSIKIIWLIELLAFCFRLILLVRLLKYFLMLLLIWLRFRKLGLFFHSLPGLIGFQAIFGSLQVLLVLLMLMLMTILFLEAVARLFFHFILRLNPFLFKGLAFEKGNLITSLLLNLIFLSFMMDSLTFGKSFPFGIILSCEVRLLCAS